MGSILVWVNMSLLSMAADVEQKALQKIYQIPGIEGNVWRRRLAWKLS